MSGAFGFDKSKTRTKDEAPQEFKNLRGPFASLLRGLIGGGGQDPLAGVPQAPDELLQAAPLGANEQALLTQLMGEGAGRQGLLDQTLAGQFLPGQESANPFLQDAIASAQRPTLEAYEQVLGRTLPGQFTQAGQFVQPGGSSPFANAAAIQSRGLAQALGDIATDISFGAYESERGRQQEAIGLSQQEVETSIQNLQAQALPRLIEQHGLDVGLQEFQRQNEALMTILSILGGVTTPALGTKQDSFGFKTSGGMMGGPDVS